MRGENVTRLSLFVGFEIQMPYFIRLKVKETMGKNKIMQAFLEFRKS